jgi:hypothetical protein
MTNLPALAIPAAARPVLDLCRNDPPLAPAEVEATCRWLGLGPEATAALAGLRAELEHDAALAEDFAACRAAVLDGRPAAGGAGSRQGLVQAFTFLHLVRLARAIHHARGIPDEVGRQTLGELGRWMEDHRQRQGCWGFDLIDWSALHLLGRIYALGRLKFELAGLPDWCAIDEAPGLAAIPRCGDPVVCVHIPASGRLDPEDCDRSFAAAHGFFPCHFPDHPFAAFICVSWMMNRQLAKVLPPDSNLVRFLGRFAPMRLHGARDDQVWLRVFGQAVVDPATAPRDTSLRRAILDHALRGGRWDTAGGFIPHPSVNHRSPP